MGALLREAAQPRQPILHTYLVGGRLLLRRERSRPIGEWLLEPLDDIRRLDKREEDVVDERVTGRGEVETVGEERVERLAR
jgi:hypothetical protein